MHIHYDSVKDVDTSLHNYFNSLKQVELYSKDILNQQLVKNNDEVVYTINFMRTSRHISVKKERLYAGSNSQMV